MMGKGIAVRRSVLAAALQLEGEAEAVLVSHRSTSRSRRSMTVRARGTSPESDSGRSVWTHLMLMKYAPAEITVLQDDDDYRPKPGSNGGEQTGKKPA
jgi:hypothetical protein